MKNQDNAVDRLTAAVERAEMPTVLFPADLIRHFPNLLNERHAARAIRMGLFGPWFSMDGDPAVLRDDLKNYLRHRTAQVEAANKELLADGEGHLRAVGTDEQAERSGEDE